MRVFSAGSLFTTLGICMIVSGDRAGWLVAGFFGLIPCVCLLRLLGSCMKSMQTLAGGRRIADALKEGFRPWRIQNWPSWSASCVRGFHDLYEFRSWTTRLSRCNPVHEKNAVPAIGLRDRCRLATSSPNRETVVLRSPSLSSLPPGRLVRQARRVLHRTAFTSYSLNELT